MELFLLYLWLKLDAICALFIVLMIFAIILSVFSWIGCSDAQDNLTKSFWKSWCKKATILSAVFVVLTTFFPSSKDVAILVGASLALDVARSPEGAKVTSLLRGKANEILDAELQKLSPKK